VVGDDGSTDATLDLLARFADQAPFPVEILQGGNRPRGPAANFAHALEYASGDWFALCDQDDVWYPTKLERLEAALLANEDTLLAFSDAALVRGDLSPLGSSVWQLVGLDSRALDELAKDKALPLLLKRYRVMGAAMAFAAEVRNLALPLPPGWPHDAWIATIAATAGRLAALPWPLVDYRQHSQNAVGGLRPTFANLVRQGLGSDRRAYLSTEITRHLHLLTRLESLLPEAPNSYRLTMAIVLVKAKLAHLERRSSLSDFLPARWPQVFKDLVRGEYSRWSTDWRSLAIDLLLPNRPPSA
jgi:glycosyltransferase involved in cell wall biosynthesis